MQINGFTIKQVSIPSHWIDTLTGGDIVISVCNGYKATKGDVSLYSKNIDGLKRQIRKLEGKLEISYPTA